MSLWTLHGDGTLQPGAVVAPDERLSWPRTIGIGAQHVVAMFGATFLVPVLTGFPPATTLLFSGVGTMLFLVITGNRLPSYLGSSFSRSSRPVTAAVASHGTGSALGGRRGRHAADRSSAPWCTSSAPAGSTPCCRRWSPGAIVALIGFNLAPAAKTNFEKGPRRIVTLVLLVAVLAFFRGIIGRLAIFLAVVVGYVLALALGDVDTSARSPRRRGSGCRQFQTPTFTSRCCRCSCPR